MNADYTITKYSLLPIDKKAHLQKWARTYFADHLRDLGFVSWSGAKTDICVNCRRKQA